MQVEPQKSIWQPAVKFCKAGWNYLSKKLTSLANWVNTFAQRVFKTIHDRPQRNADPLKRPSDAEWPVVKGIAGYTSELHFSETLQGTNVFPPSPVVPDPNEQRKNELTNQKDVLANEIQQLNTRVEVINLEIKKLQEIERELREKDDRIKEDIRQKQALLDKARANYTALSGSTPWLDYEGDIPIQRNKESEKIKQYEEEINVLKSLKTNKDEIGIIVKNIEDLQTNNKQLSVESARIVQQRLGVLDKIDRLKKGDSVLK